MTARVVCITVIDEALNSISNSQAISQWDAFRETYPNRWFYILDPGGGSFGYIPPKFAADPKAFGPIFCSRDGGNVNFRSDWFNICGLETASPGSVVSLAVDTSGSMTLNTVKASYNYFIERCAEANFPLVIDTTFPNERWIPPHNKAVPPGVDISATLTEITEGNSSTLIWTSAGDVNTISINQGIGNVQLNGIQPVSPSVGSITYTITATGPEGTATDSVTIDVYPFPAIDSLTISNNDFLLGSGSLTVSWTTTGAVEVELTGSSDAFGSTGAPANPAVDGSHTFTPTKGGFFTIKLVAYNYLGAKTDAIVSFTVRDETPNLFNFTDSDENKPTANQNIESNTITINGFGPTQYTNNALPIKSNYPIEVQVNADGVWRNVQQIT